MPPPTRPRVRGVQPASRAEMRVRRRTALSLSTGTGGGAPAHKRSRGTRQRRRVVTTMSRSERLAPPVLPPLRPRARLHVCVGPKGRPAATGFFHFSAFSPLFPLPPGPVWHSVTEIDGGGAYFPKQRVATTYRQRHALAPAESVVNWCVIVHYRYTGLSLITASFSGSFSRRAPTIPSRRRRIAREAAARRHCHTRVAVTVVRLRRIWQRSSRRPQYPGLRAPSFSW